MFIERFNHWFSFLILSIIPLVFVPVLSFFDFYYAPKVYAMMVFSLFFLIYVFNKRSTIEEVIDFDRCNALLLIYTALLIVSVFFSGNMDISLGGSFYRSEGLSTLLMYFLIYVASRFAAKLTLNQMTGVLITAAIVALYGIVQLYGFDPFPKDVVRINWQDAHSTIGNPNFLGSFMVLMVPLGLIAFLKRGRLIELVLYALLLYGMFATQTRSAYIGVLFVVISLVILIWKHRTSFDFLKKRIIILVLTSICVIIVFNASTNNSIYSRIANIFYEATTLISSDTTIDTGNLGSGRIYIWTHVLQLIKEKPWFGFGIDNLAEPFASHFMDETTAYFNQALGVDKAHNEYLNIAVTSGIPSLIAYLFFIVSVLKIGLKKVKVDPYYIPFFAAAVGYLAQATFNISVVSVAYVFWVFLGFLSSHETSDAVRG